MAMSETTLQEASPHERLAHYHRMVDEAIKNAEASRDASLRNIYLEIATGWKILAADTERFIHYAAVSRKRG
jgi:hypothetical protein